MIDSSCLTLIFFSYLTLEHFTAVAIFPLYLSTQKSENEKNIF